MKLKTIDIENYRSIKKLSFDFPETGIVLVGGNNAGKSNNRATSSPVMTIVGLDGRAFHRSK